MKKILMIAPNSYPINGAEHIVNIKLLQILSNADFEIDLISKRNKRENYPSAKFESLGIKVNSLNIVEVDNQFSFVSLYQHILCFFKFGVVYKGSHWAIKALPIAKKLVKQNQYNYVLTKNSPSPLIGYYLKKKYNLKWIATWNDPYPRVKYPKPYGRGIKGPIFILARRQIPIFRKYVDVHIFPSDRLRDYMLQYLHVDRNKTTIIPHVVSEMPKRKDRSVLSGKKLKIIHSGNVRSPRNPVPFLEALNNFIKIHKDAPIQVTFLGVVDNDFHNKVLNLDLHGHVELVPPVDYFTSIQMLSEFHLAIIIEAPCKEGVFLPTKVTDYFQAGISIFSISPAVGVLNDLYKTGHIKYFANCISIKDIEEELHKIYNDFLNNNINDFAGIKEEFYPESAINQYKSF